MAKILTVVGNRPQFIKAAVVSRAIADRNAATGSNTLVEELVHTGQHYDRNMSQAFFDEMDIPAPVVNLSVGSGSHAVVTGAMLVGLEREMLKRRPDVVLVYGDTNSTLAGALSAAKLNVPLCHVEAGLRSFNKNMPEEINRVVTDRLSNELFCPSQRSRDQLHKEGIVGGVHVVGDVMFDAVLHYRHKAVPAPFDTPFILATVHRAENTDERTRLINILEALQQAPCKVVLLLHPRTRKRMQREGIRTAEPLIVSEPLSYFGMLGCLQRCELVVTDSGGLQKEAFYLGKQCVTVRDETEWTELVELGVNQLVGASREKIERAFERAGKPVAAASGLYGDGDAGERIAERLAQL